MKSQQSRREFMHSSAVLLGAPFLPFPSSQAAGRRITTIAGNGVAGTAADGSSADSAQINNPYGVVIGPDGGLYWADFGSNRVLRLDLKTRRITVIAGNATKGHSGDGGPAKSAQLSAPHEVRFDSKGNMYVAERDSHVVRHIDMKTQVITTLAGTGVAGYSGDGGPAAMAQLNQPHSIVLDKADNVFICDINNNRVRKIDPKTGIIATFVGTGTNAATPDEGGLLTSPVAAPRSIEIAPDGTMYLILRAGNKVLAINPTQGTLKRIAGTGELGYAGDGGPALVAKFGAPGSPLNGPKGIALGNNVLYIVDTENHVIRGIDLRTGIISTVAGTGQRGDGPEGDPLMCKMNRPHGVFISGRSIYIGDSEAHRIRLLE
jgi:DNA-binding beta-propeller fold protein YncE